MSAVFPYLEERRCVMNEVFGTERPYVTCVWRSLAIDDSFFSAAEGDALSASLWCLFHHASCYCASASVCRQGAHRSDRAFNGETLRLRGTPRAEHIGASDSLGT